MPGIHGLLSRLNVLGHATPRQFTVRFDDLSYSGSMSQQIDRHIYHLVAYAPQFDSLVRSGT